MASPFPAGVFAVQCPNPKCRKFMLVEDKDRGGTVQCLLCNTTIRIAAPSPSQASEPESRRKN